MSRPTDFLVTIRDGRMVACMYIGSVDGRWMVQPIRPETGEPIRDAEDFTIEPGDAIQCRSLMDVQVELGRNFRGLNRGPGWFKRPGKGDTELKRGYAARMFRS